LYLFAYEGITVGTEPEWNQLGHAPYKVFVFKLVHHPQPYNLVKTHPEVSLELLTATIDIIPYYIYAATLQIITSSFYLLPSKLLVNACHFTCLLI